MWNWISQAEELRKSGKPFVMITTTQVTGSTPREPGAKMLVLADGRFFGTIGGGNLERLALEDAKRVLHESGSAQLIRYPLGAKTGQCCGGVMEILFEPMNNGPRLYIFGAGHVGQAVSRNMTGTPFQVHLIDPRPEWLDSPQVPDSVIRHSEDWDDFVETALWDAQKTYAVVMTHRHDLDQEIISSLLLRPARYIGLIGSQSKWLRFQQRLLAKDKTEADLARVKSPIGLPIGGKAPQEVAISLAAELIQSYYEKNQ